jgi:hypothetical protein
MGTYLNSTPIVAFISTFPILCCWAILWVTKSSTYRSGLFLGALTSFGVMLNQSMIIFTPLVVLLIVYFERKTKTKWYLRQLLKYASGGIILSLILVMTGNFELFNLRLSSLEAWWNNLINLIDQKAFYTLFFIGTMFMLFRMSKSVRQKIYNLKIEDNKVLQIFLIYMVSLGYGIFFEPMFIVGFSSMWILAFLSLLPVEWIFQSISRLRSRRNLIYVVYILVCLLDSHFEGRVKTFLKFIKY